MSRFRHHLPTQSREDHIRSIKTGQILSKLQSHIDGEMELSQTQLKACDLLLSRTIPVLSAVEHTTVSDMDKLTEAQIIDKIANLLQANPDLAKTLTSIASVRPSLQGKAEVVELGEPDGE